MKNELCEGGIFPVMAHFSVDGYGAKRRHHSSVGAQYECNLGYEDSKHMVIKISLSL